MYIATENIQATQSKEMISEALIRLMDRYVYKDITITQICQDAQVVRQTFYRNFETKDDVLEYYLDEIFRNYITQYYSNLSDSGLDILNFYKFLELKKQVLTSLEKNQMIFMIDRTITRNLSKYFELSVVTRINIPHLEAYVSDFISSTVCSILSRWIRNGYRETTEELRLLTSQFLSGLSKDEMDNECGCNLTNLKVQ